MKVDPVAPVGPVIKQRLRGQDRLDVTPAPTPGEPLPPLLGDFLAIAIGGLVIGQAEVGGGRDQEGEGRQEHEKATHPPAPTGQTIHGLAPERGAGTSDWGNAQMSGTPNFSTKTCSGPMRSIRSRSPLLSNPARFWTTYQAYSPGVHGTKSGFNRPVRRR